MGYERVPVALTACTWNADFAISSPGLRPIARPPRLMRRLGGTARRGHAAPQRPAAPVADRPIPRLCAEIEVRAGVSISRSQLSCSTAMKARRWRIPTLPATGRSWERTCAFPRLGRRRKSRCWVLSITRPASSSRTNPRPSAAICRPSRTTGSAPWPQAGTAHQAGGTGQGQLFNPHQQTLAGHPRPLDHRPGLAKYTQELSDIETIWRDLKARHLAHQAFADADAHDKPSIKPSKTSIWNARSFR